MRKRKNQDYIVNMRVERDITVYVQAVDEDEARSKALEWDIVGNEEENETINMEVRDVRLNT